MNASDPRQVLSKLHGLRTELVELAFVLDRGGRIDAADVAMTISGRVGELCAELTGAGGSEARSATPNGERTAP
jgi:hypothetical protein